MLKSITIIGLGGAIGSMLRYAITQTVDDRFTPVNFPYGTLLVNITGCFIIGLIYALSDKLNMSAELRGFLATGICGGYTTFSAFSLQSVNLIKGGYTSQALIYVSASVILGLIATFIPIVVFQKLS